MQTPDPTSDNDPKPSLYPRIGDVIARKLSREKIESAVVLNIYEDMLGERVYHLQTAWRLVYLKGPHLLEQSLLDNLGYFLATRQDFQSDYQGIIAWYLSRREELYQTISPFVDDTPSAGYSTRPIPLEASPWQQSHLLQYLNINLDEDQPERSFRPCIGDILMRSVEPNMGSCAVVLNILENAFGDRVYHLQTTLGLASLKGPDQLTQAQLDHTTYHPTTRENFQEALQGAYDWYQDRRNELYQAVKPFVEDPE